MTPRLFRVVLPCDAMDPMVAFYEKVLEMPGERIAPFRHYFTCGPTILALVSQGEYRVRHRPNQDYIYFSVDDLEATHARVLEAGPSKLDAADQEPGIALRPWGERSFYCNDPAGNPICFVEAGTEFTIGRS